MLESRLRARYGSDLPIAYRVDPAILGGLIVRVGDRYIDGSVAASWASCGKVWSGRDPDEAAASGTRGAKRVRHAPEPDVPEYMRVGHGAAGSSNQSESGLRRNSARN